ncbi:MAG: oxidoreductase, partial [Muribaculaceae bacterium]|nr:oxidoreductase [Muribaculaceae bacterium]
FTDISPGWIRTPLLHDGTKYPFEMTLDYAVERIVRAIDRKNRVAVIDWRWRLLVWLWRLVPDCIWTRINAGIMIGR